VTILSSSTTGLLKERALLPSYWLSDASTMPNKQQLQNLKEYKQNKLGLQLIP